MLSNYNRLNMMTIVLNNKQIKANKVERYNNIIVVEFLEIAVACSAVGVKLII